MSVKQQQDSFLDRQKQKETERQALDAFELGEKLLSQALEHAYTHNLLHVKVDTHPEISEKQSKGERDPEEQLEYLYSAAIMHFSDAIELEMTRIEFYFARAKTYFLCKEFHRYVFDLSIALHVDEENYALYVARAHGFWKLGKFKEAVLDMDFAIEKAISLEEELRAQRKKAVSMNEKEVKNLQEIPIISNITLADLYYRRGVCKYDLHEWNECIEDFTKCVELEEGNINAYVRRGAAYMKSGRKEGELGVADLRKAVETVGVDTLVHLRYYKLGQALLEVGSNEQAVDAFTSAIDAAQNFLNERKTRKRRKNTPIDSKSFYRQIILSWYDGLKFRIMEFDAPEPVELYDELLPLDETVEKKSYPEFFAARGKAKALLGHHQDALADFSTSIEQDDNNAQTYFERSAAKRIMGEYSEALDDIEFCARRRLNSDVAYYKAIILENEGKIDESLTLYESILKGVFERQFSVELLEEFGDDVSVINEVEKQSLMNEEFETEKVACNHLNSLFHASLLHRVKLNFPRAILLIQRAIEIESDDDRFYDVLAMLYYDTLNYDSAIAYIEKSIAIQIVKPTGVNWETYYIKAVCEMEKKMYNTALESLILAEQRPGGGMREKLLLEKKAEADKVIYWLAWLPPGSPLATAYHITNNIESIPRDPLSPSSAARGEQNELIFPLLDLKGAFPGYYNHFINLKKAECLFYLGDFVGCVRCVSKTLDDFDFNKHTRNGVRLMTNAMLLIRQSKTIKTPAEHYNKENETEWLTEAMEVPLSQNDRDYLYNIYFLRARALYQLNRLPHALKDCGKAYYIVAKQEQYKERIPLGVGSVLFFMAKIYANLRLYNKCFHCARDSLIAGIPYFAVFRAYYMEGVALVYERRLRLAEKCFSLALRANFTARMARRINERIDQTGVIELPSLEEISIYLQANMHEIENLHLDIPKLRDKTFEMPEERKPKIFNDINRNKRVTLDEETFEPRIEQLRLEFDVSAISQLEYDVEPFNDYILMQNKDFQTPSALPNELLRLISLPRVWLCEENAFIMHERAKTFEMMGLNELACDDFTALIRIQPENPRYYFRRAFSLKKLGLFEFAAVDFLTAQKLDSNSPEFQVDFERLNDDFIEICCPGNEEFYVPPACEIIEKKNDEELRKYKFYYDVYGTFDDAIEKREWTFYSVKDVENLYDYVDEIYGVEQEFGADDEEASENSVSEDRNREEAETTLNEEIQQI